MAYTTENIRNIAMVGHSGSGKTLLTEALLYKSGKISAQGSIEKGTTVSDFDPLEKEHLRSLDTSLVGFDYKSAKVNLLDTPGFSDFLGHAFGVLPAVENALIVVNAQTGVEPVTVRMMERAQDRGLCRVIVVNKIDAEDVDLENVIEQIQDAFGKECIPINLPAKNKTEVIACFSNSEGDSDILDVASVHTALIEQVVEVDDDLMNRYFESGTENITTEELRVAFAKAMRTGHFIPICFTSAVTGVGVPNLLNIIEKWLPSPIEIQPPVFIRPSDDQPVELIPDPKLPFFAHVFKIMIDPFVGKLALFRVFQGTITSDTKLFIDDAKKSVKVGHLLTLHGKERPEIEKGIPGDICAVNKIDELHVNSILHDSFDENSPKISMAARFPVPLAGVAIRAKSRNDEQRMADVLHKLMEEDPCLSLEHSQATKETILRGLSDLHLRVILEKMQQRYKLEITTRPPRIAYRETINAQATSQYRHKKQSGGAGQFGEVYLRIEPLPRGEGFEFASEVVGGAIPSQFIPAVEKGVREAMQEGPLSGSPIQDIRVVVTDGKYHPVDSKEIAFVTAGREAFYLAFEKAQPKILEPIVTLNIEVNSEDVGNITGDMLSRRGRIVGQDALKRNRVSVVAQAPLAELDDYISKLKAMTNGSGIYTMEFSHYDPVPGNVQQNLITQYKNASAGEA